MRQARTRISPERALFLAATLILIVGTQIPVASHVSPKSGLGYALGAVGGILLLSQALYAFRKRLLTVRLLMMLGIIAPVLILIHCGFSLGATNSNIALAAMLLVTCSGLCGRHFYSKIHRGDRDGVELPVYDRLLSIWRVLHIAVFLVLLAASIVHVISVHVY
jgi:hypothetical protein